MQPSAGLVAVEFTGEGVRLVDGSGVRVRSAGEVDEVAAQPAAHRPIGRHRRVVPAGEQHQGASAGADGQPARPLVTVPGDIALLVVDLDRDSYIRVGEVHRHRSQSFLDARAEKALELRRGHLEALVPALDPHGEADPGLLGTGAGERVHEPPA